MAIKLINSKHFTYLFYKLYPHSGEKHVKYPTMVWAGVTIIHRDVHTHSKCHTRCRSTHASLTVSASSTLLSRCAATPPHPHPTPPPHQHTHTRTRPAYTTSLAYRPLRAIIQCKQGGRKKHDWS